MLSYCSIFIDHFDLHFRSHDVTNHFPCIYRILECVPKSESFFHCGGVLFSQSPKNLCYCCKAILTKTLFQNNANL